MIDYYETKAHPITKKMVLDAFKEIRNNGKAAGIDGTSIEEYAVNLQSNLYKLWNRLTSGSYFPSLVREKLIPKKGGGFRSLGICTVEDRIAQQVVRKRIEYNIDPTFHSDSYGYRPGRHAHHAIKMAMVRCARFSWVVDIDVKSFFDKVDHDLMMKAIRRYTDEKWVLMYIERWLKTGILREHGEAEERHEGTLQGAVISPLLANVFLHFVFDKWMEKHYPQLQFERYCDDIIVHCQTFKQAAFMKGIIGKRMKECKLEMSREKTRVVYVKNPYNKGQYETFKPVSFDFLGYTLQPRLVPTRNGKLILTTPTMSQKSKNSVMDKVRDLELYKRQGSIQLMAKQINEKARGWINYYGAFNKWGLRNICVFLNRILIKWTKRERQWNTKRAIRWLKQVFRTQPGLFVHWEIIQP